MKLEVKHFFHAAHQLPDSDNLVTKECARLHGHTYAVKVVIKGQENKRNGMIVDFKAVKQIIDKLDHRFLNDILLVDGKPIPTTAENTALYLKGRIGIELGFYERDIEITICEGYKGEDLSSWVMV